MDRHMINSGSYTTLNTARDRSIDDIVVKDSSRTSIYQTIERVDKKDRRGYRRRNMSLTNDIRYDNANEPIITGEACEIPESLKSEMRKHSTDRAAVDVLLEQLEKQKTQAASLAEMHRQLHLSERAMELDKLADQAAYAIAVFNRRLRQHREVPYYFQLLNLPQPNVNLDLPPDILEVADIRSIDYVTPTDCGSSLETFVQLEMTMPTTKKTQRIKTNWMHYVNGAQYQPSPLRFNVASGSEAYVQYLQLEQQLKATVYYNRGVARRSGIFGWTYFTITDLLQSANVLLTVNLNAEHGAVPGYLKIHLRQRAPLKGLFFARKKKPWLFLAVDDITRITASPVSESDPSKPPHQGIPMQSNKPLSQQARSDREIIQELRNGLSYDVTSRKTLSLLREKMNVQYNQRVLDNSTSAISQYCDALSDLLRRYKEKRKEAESSDQIRPMKYYLKREMIIKGEMARYRQGSRVLSGPSQRNSTHLNGNGLTHTFSSDSNGYKRSSLPMDQSKRVTTIDDLDVGSSAHSTHMKEPRIPDWNHKVAVRNHGSNDRSNDTLIVYSKEEY